MTAAETGADAAPADEVHAGEARAKVNLWLHVTGRRADGYHLLDSLAVFPAVSDRLTARPAETLSLEIRGPFAGALGAGADNLVLRAARALAAAHGVTRGASLVLDKNLPPAAGIGGGSADAAAALRLLSRLWGVEIPDDLPASLGADVPVCLAAPTPRRMGGIGERLSQPPALPGFWIVLTNPGAAVATPQAFAALARRDNPPAPPLPVLPDFGALVHFLGPLRNDLEPAARTLCPAVAEALDALADAPLARMSGSGATCFALHATQAAALDQAETVRRARPDWWIAAARVAPWPGAGAREPAAAGPASDHQAGAPR